MSQRIVSLSKIVEGATLTAEQAVCIQPMLAISQGVSQGIVTLQQVVDSLRLLTGRRDSEVVYHATISVVIAKEVAKISTSAQDVITQLLRYLPPPFNSRDTLYWGMQTDLVVIEGRSQFDQLVWGCEYLVNSSHYKACSENQNFQLYPAGPLILSQMLENYCSKTLIQDDGKPMAHRLEHLRVFTGVESVVVDKDQYGPLIYGLQFPNGVLAYH